MATTTDEKAGTESRGRQVAPLRRVLYRICSICRDRIGVVIDCNHSHCYLDGVDFHYHCDDDCCDSGCIPVKVYNDGHEELDDA